jgi:hypothetical protein
MKTLSEVKRQDDVKGHLMRNRYHFWEYDW